MLAKICQSRWGRRLLRREVLYPLFGLGMMLGVMAECSVDEQGYGPPHTPACAYQGCP